MKNTFEEYSPLRIKMKNLLYLEIDQMKRIVYNCYSVNTYTYEPEKDKYNTERYKADRYKLNKRNSYEYILVIYTKISKLSEKELEEAYENFYSNFDTPNKLHIHLQWWNNFVGIEKIEFYIDCIADTNVWPHDIRLVYIDYYKKLRKCTWEYLWQSIDETDPTLLRQQLQTSIRNEQFRKNLPALIYEKSLNRIFDTKLSKKNTYNHLISIIIKFL